MCKDYDSAFIQAILDIASEFFVVNDISINNDKTVTISINQGVKTALFLINGLPISIAKRDISYRYLGIFLSIKSFSKPSLAQAYANVRFFSNVVLKKTITDKQFSYLVSVVFQFIVSYQMQFSYVSSSVYYKWDVMIRKGLRSKAGLPKDFLNEVLHHSSLYSLKPFEQVQFKGKLASLISFSNAHNIFGHLFEHRFLDLQHPVRLRVSPVNNFLAGVIRILLENELSLINNLPSTFRGSSRFLMFDILSCSLFFDSDVELEDILVVEEIGFKGPGTLLHAFEKVVSVSNHVLPVLNVLDSEAFACVCEDFLEVWSNCIEVYTDRFLKGVGSAKVTSGTAAYFLATDMDIGVRVQELLLSTLAELQAIVLALECVSSSCSVVLYLDSQFVINAYVSESLVMKKDVLVRWVKVKRHSGVLGNVKANKLADKATFSSFSLSVGIQERFLVAEDTTTVCYAHWKASPGYDIVLSVMIKEINWAATLKIWHPDSHMLSGFISKNLANMCTYLIKAIYRWLLVAVRKKLYDVNYSGVLYLLCGEVEVSDHIFVCSSNAGLRDDILANGLFTAVCKGFVLKNWYAETALAFERKGKTTLTVTEFARFVHRVDIERAGLVKDGGVILGLSHCLVSNLSDGVVYLLNVVESFTVSFGRHKLCYFFSGLSGDVFFHMDV
ncbi:hypothetical protein G9A89_019396 [Geosiphon pyriformis]|nr:hypothetical protein G9A89_019396 [Geosiphon pyriformis]